MLCCIIFLLTSFITNAAAHGETKQFSQSFTVTIYPNNSTVTGSNVGLSESGGTATYKIKLDNDPATHATGTYNSNTGYINISPAYYDIDGTATPNSSTTSGTITGTIGSAGGYSYFDTDLEFELIPLLFKVSDFDSNYPFVGLSAWGINTSVNQGSLTSSRLVFSDGDTVNSIKFFGKENIYRTNQSIRYLAPTFLYRTHLSYVSTSLLTSPITFTFTISFTVSCADYSSSVVANNSTPTQDIQGNNLQQQNNNITQDTNTTTHDTNNKITSFFNSFFDNLLHIFVPEDGFFSQWFNSLNDFMAQKLGFLWSPFDFLISFLNGVYSGGGSACLVFPELAWIDGTVIIPRTEFSFDNIGGESFTELRDMIYFATDVVLLGAVVSQFYKKIKLVFEGGGD